MPAQAQTAPVLPPPSEWRAWELALRNARVKLAQRNPSTFCELVLKDEMTGKPIHQAPIHDAFQELVSQYPRLVIWAHNEAGKTSQISIGRVLWELGKNPSIRIAVISNTSTQARKTVRTIAQYVENSPELHAVFPDLVPGKKTAKEPWTESQLAVKRPHTSRTPSVQAFGLHGNITGDRIDLMILDDVLDEENTIKSPRLMKDLQDWYDQTLVGRTTAHSRIVAIGTAFHPDDLLHTLGRKPAFKAFRYPVVDDDKKSPTFGQPRWPERWPLSRIEARRMEVPADKFARTMLCEARDDRTSRFKRDWIDRCKLKGDRPNAVLMNQPGDYLKTVPAGCQVFTGVDLAVSKVDSADLVCFFTILVAPNGDRHILNIESGHWYGPNIRDKIIDHARRFQSIVVVENNAAQDYVAQFTREISAVPVRTFTTGARNKEFGIESLAVELENAKWVIPNQAGICEPEVDAWIRELLYYDPAAHTGDRLMASLFARDGAYATGPSAPQGEVGYVDLLSR